MRLIFPSFILVSDKYVIYEICLLFHYSWKMCLRAELSVNMCVARVCSRDCLGLGFCMQCMWEKKISIVRYFIHEPITMILRRTFLKKKRIHNFSGCYFWLTFRPFLHHEYISLILNNSQHYHNKTFIRDRLGHGGSDVEWRLWWWWWWCRRRWPRPRCTLTSNSRGSFSRARSRSSKR